MIASHKSSSCASDEPALIAKAQRLLSEGKSQRHVAAQVGKPRIWVRSLPKLGSAPAIIESEPHTGPEFAARIAACCQRSVEAVFETGRLLVKARATLPHGEFEAMVEDDLPFGPRSARMLMAIASDPRLLNWNHGSVLPTSWRTLYEITRLDDAALEARIADGTIRPDMKRQDIATVAKQVRRDQREHDLAAKILALPDKRYGVILADWPRKPWAWSDETGFDRAPDNHYVTQTFRWAVDVLAPMIQRLAAPDAVLMLLSTAASLVDDIEIMAEAGFCALRPRGPDGRLLRDADGEPLAAVSPGGGTYRSHQVWDKMLVGMGRWFRDRHELVLVGVRGKIPCPAPGTQALSLFAERRGEHSAKPDFIAAEIERLWPHFPKIELFRRGPARPGWDAYGDQAELIAQDPETPLDFQPGNLSGTHVIGTNSHVGSPA